MRQESLRMRLDVQTTPVYQNWAHQCVSLKNCQQGLDAPLLIQPRLGWALRSLAWIGRFAKLFWFTCLFLGKIFVSGAAYFSEGLTKVCLPAVPVCWIVPNFPDSNTMAAKSFFICSRVAKVHLVNKLSDWQLRTSSWVWREARCKNPSFLLALPIEYLIDNFWVLPTPSD